MSELHVRQIRAYLEKTFRHIVDLSDLNGKPEAEITENFLTRALSAFALSYIANIKPNDSARAITDGYHDNGIDAIFYHPTDRMLYLVQSKWHNTGAGSISRGEMQKFLTGLRDLLNARWERFNTKISCRSSELDAALDDASTRITLLVAHTGQQTLSEEVVRDIQDQMDELNDPTELVSKHSLRQADLYAAVAQGLEGSPINIDLALYEWGHIREPYFAYYGQVAAADIASWFGTYQHRLLAPNIRMFLGATDVNQMITQTLSTSPQDFWYFNNGITALCRSIKKKPIGGNSRETGFFECKDLRIVNGAQTVGAIHQATTRYSELVARARVAVRLIALENCPPEFEKLITRYNNTQNRIDRRDFVALDPEQERIRGEMQLEGISYVYKSGEVLPSTATGFDLVEATVARACLQTEVSYAVQAKREIGKLWDDIVKPPYKILFNPSVDGPSLWRAVQVVRQVEQALVKQKKSSDGRRRLLAVHGNRFITHMVLSSIPASFYQTHQNLNMEEQNYLESISSDMFEKVWNVVNIIYADAYLAMLFKNLNKCQQLKNGL